MKFSADILLPSCLAFEGARKKPPRKNLVQEYIYKNVLYKGYNMDCNLMLDFW